MALRTLGSAATNTLRAVAFNQSSGVMTDSDLALLNAALLSDLGQSGDLNVFVDRAGQLYIPRRGFLTVLPGDFIAYDPATGWPILLSASAAAGASYVHN